MTIKSTRCSTCTSLRLMWLLLYLVLVFSPSCLAAPLHFYGNALNLHHGHLDDRHHHHHQHNQRRFLQHNEDPTSVLTPAKPRGDDSCPCLTAHELANYPRDFNDNARQELGVDTNLTEYGVNCMAHDLSTPACANVGDCITKIPLPENCDKSYCRRSFCYVNATQCHVEHSQSFLWPDLDLHFSYATCGYLDSYTSIDRLNSLRNKTLKVGFNSNTGGWKGAFNVHGHFAANGQWDGPLIHFIRDAALRGGFELQGSAPPDWLINSSQAFFGGSPFDLCVYATSLGYLDMCVSGFTVTTKRASVATFFELTSDPVYLVTFSNTQESSVNTFLSQLATIFRPFTWGSWLMIICFVLPVLGALMLFHEYGTPGSAFPKERDLQVINHETGQVKVQTEPVPFLSQVGKAMYMSFLSFTSESYDVGVITMGGKIHLLGVFAFLILVLAVYTANLAAILTTSAQSHAVESLEEALQAGYNFCVNRKVGDTLSKLYNIPPERFVVDPTSEGGDGQPGFNCGRCQARQRTVDFMKQNHDDPSLYCDAAIMAQQDLQVNHQYGIHCNKTVVGEILTFITFGMPMAGSISNEMMSWLYKMKYEGLLTQHLQQAEPISQCAAKLEQSEGIGLTIQQLTGIWVIVFTFAVGGLIAKAMHYYQSNRSKTVEIQKVLIYDQWGRAMENLELKRPRGDLRKSMKAAAAAAAAENDPLRNVPRYVNTPQRSSSPSSSSAQPPQTRHSAPANMTSASAIPAMKEEVPETYPQLAQSQPQAPPSSAYEPLGPEGGESMLLQPPNVEPACVVASQSGPKPPELVDLQQPPDVGTAGVASGSEPPPCC